MSEERERADAAEEGREVIERYRETFGERGVEVARVWRPTLADQVVRTPPGPGSASSPRPDLSSNQR